MNPALPSPGRDWGSRPIDLRTATCIALCGSLLPACSEDDDWVETRHARIQGEFGVCAGLEAYVDERIELTAEWLELEPGPKIDIYFGPSYVDEQQDRFDHNIGGLASRMDGHVTVYTTGWALGHELVHAVRYSNGLVLPSLIDEGVAQLYDGGEFRGNGGTSYRIPEGATLPEDPQDAAVGESATFTGWLHETLPHDAFISLINDPELNRTDEPARSWERIERATGMSKEVLEQRWATEAADIYSEVSGCRPERQHSLASGDVLHIEDQVSCADSPTSFGPYQYSDEMVYVAQRWHCITLDEPRRVRVTVAGPSGSAFTLAVLGESCLTTPRLDEAKDTRHIPFGTSAEFMMGDCRWVTFIRSDPETVGDVSITIEALD